MERSQERVIKNLENGITFSMMKVGIHKRKEKRIGFYHFVPDSKFYVNDGHEIYFTLYDSSLSLFDYCNLFISDDEIYYWKNI